jgi:hypothetical protein
MHTAFRQGIILSPYDTNKHPTFLRVVKNTAFPGRYDVDLIGEYSLPVITTLAFGQSEVLLNVDTVQKSICSFGTPTAPIGVRYWIYQQYDIVTKTISYSSSQYEPVYDVTAPSALSGQLWFNTSTNIMYRWSGISWSPIVAVVLGSFEPNTSVITQAFGSSAGLTYTHNTLSTVKLYLDTNTLRDDSVLMDSLQHEYYPIESLYVDPNFNHKHNILISGTAIVACSAFTYVRVDTDGRMSPASYSDIGAYQVGIITEDVAISQTTNVIIFGLVSNPSWNFAAAGASLWVSSAGAITTSDPAQLPLKNAIGKTASRTSIVLGSTSGSAIQATSSGSSGGTTPSPVIAANVTSTINLPIANGADSIALGIGATTNSQGSIAQASGVFTGMGDAQAVSYVVRNVTTNATPQTLYLDGVSEAMLIADGTTLVFEGLVVGRSQTSTDAAGFSISGLVTKQSGANTLEFVGTPSISVISRSNAAWDVLLSVNTFSGALQIKARGVSGETIHWVANVKTAEVK